MHTFDSGLILSQILISDPISEHEVHEHPCFVKTRFLRLRQSSWNLVLYHLFFVLGYRRSGLHTRSGSSDHLSTLYYNLTSPDWEYHWNRPYLAGNGRPNHGLKSFTASTVSVLDVHA